MAFRRDIADFGAFYERTYDVAYRTALGIVHDAGLAADVTQEAYVSAYRHRDRFRGEAPSGAWLHRIVVNQALGALRRRRAARDEADLSPFVVSPDDAGSVTTRIALFDALRSLPPRQRAAVILRYYLDYDYATIARVLGTSSTNVGAMLSRAMDRLRLVLDPQPGAVASKAVGNP